MRANCQLTQRDGDGPEADAIALFTSMLGGDGRCASNVGFLNGRARRLGPFSTAGACRLRAFVHYRSSHVACENIYAALLHTATIKNESTHSKMGPVRQNPIHRTVSLFMCVCIALCTIVAHNIAQKRPDNFPSYPPGNHHCSDDVYLRERGIARVG